MKIKKITQNTRDFNITDAVTDGGTDLNEVTFNQLQTDIENELFYKDGDKFNRKSDLSIGGYITTSSTAFYFTLYLPKRLDNISSITINKFNFTIRGLTGYIQTAIEMEEFDGTITVSISSENSVTFKMLKNTAFEATNNTVAGIEINSLQLTFNE